MYNRTSAYEAILSGLKQRHSSDTADATRYNVNVPFDPSELTDGGTIFSGMFYTQPRSWFQ